MTLLRAVPAHDGTSAQCPPCASNSDGGCKKEKPRVLVTGADGFVGRHLVRYLAMQGYHVIAASRGTLTFDDPNIRSVSLPDLSQKFDWKPFVEQCLGYSSPCRHCSQGRRRSTFRPRKSPRDLGAGAIDFAQWRKTLDIHLLDRSPVRLLC